MAASVLFLVVAFIILLVILGLIIYQFICLSDLELDYINPYDLAATINALAVPELALHGLLAIIFLFTSHWLLFFFCLPLLLVNLRLYLKRQHLVDVTEIFGQVGREKTRRLFKAAGVLALLFVTLFWLIWVILEED
ncbi:protein cornichon homolog 1-like [Wolffia australiana]